LNGLLARHRLGRLRYLRKLRRMVILFCLSGLGIASNKCYCFHSLIRGEFG
jgi:hypothetical protein